MESNQNVVAMALFIAQAIYAQACKGLEDELTWNELEEDMQAQFLLTAHAAMGAHDAWRTAKGFRLVKMNRKERRAVERPGLIDTAGRQLIGAA